MEPRQPPATSTRPPPLLPRPGVWSHRTATGSGLGQGIMPGARRAAAQPRPTPAQHKPAILAKTKAGRGRAALVSPWWVSGPCRTSAVGTGGRALLLGVANQISPGQPRHGRQEEAQLRALGLLPSPRARTLLPSVGRPDLPVGARAALSPPWTPCPACKTNVLSGTFQASPGQLAGKCRGRCGCPPARRPHPGAGSLFRGQPCLISLP